MKLNSPRVLVTLLMSSAACFAVAPAAHAQVAAQASDDGAQRATPSSIERQLNELQREVQTLKQEQHTMVHTQAAEDRVTWHLKGTNKSVAPVFVSPDGDSFMSIGGRIQADGAMGQLPGRDDNTTDIAFRRVRINVKGQFDKYWIWKLQYDFLKSGSDGIKDAFVGYHGLLGGVYHIALLGNTHVPFGMQTPSNDRTWMESGLASNAFRPSREIGVADRMSQRHWNLWFGAFKGQNPAGSSPPYGGTADFLTSADLALNLVNEPGHLVRIGNSILYQRFATGGTKYKTFPDSHNYGADLVSTPSLLGVRSDIVYSPNIALEYNQLSFHANYYMVDADDTVAVSSSARTNGENKASFSGWSVQAEYNLTGEIRPYSTKEGNFGAIHPLHPITEGGLGALQLKVRLDSIDLNDQRHHVEGGHETNFDVGLNWFPTSYTRAELEYVKVFKLDGGPYNGYAPSIIQGRLQFVF
jgi:phosphate-selective porin OprO/OprP